MPQEDLVLFNPCSSSLWRLIPPGTTEEFKRAGGHNLKWLHTMCCTQHNPLSQIWLLYCSLEISIKFYYVLAWEVTVCLFCDPSQSLGWGLWRRLWARPAFEEEAAPQSHYLHSRAAGGAGEGLRTHTLPRHLHTRGTGSAGQTDRGSSSG